jgi:hypothetical protein
LSFYIKLYYIMKQRISHTQTSFDRQFNLMYIPSYKSIEEEDDQNASGFWGKKSKSSTGKSNLQMNNILIHDIPKDMEFWYFQENDLEEGEYVRAFMFEQYFDAVRGMMHLSGYGAYQQVNNFELSDRSVQNRLLVETYQPQNKVRRLWLGDKWGIDKIPLVELEKQTFWHYDVYNLMIRIFKENENSLEIQTLDF